MSLQLIHKYYQFLLEYKRELDKKNHTAFHELRKKHKINGMVLTILKNHGIIAGGRGQLKWVKGNVSTEMAERLIEELRRKAKLMNEKRKEVAKTDENEIIQSNNEKQIIQALEKEREELREKLIEHRVEVAKAMLEDYSSPKVQAKPKPQQRGLKPAKPFKLKDWQEFVLVYIISAIISYLILAFIKMDANLIQWNPFYRALIGFYIPTFILILWIKSKSK